MNIAFPCNIAMQCCYSAGHVVPKTATMIIYITGLSMVNCWRNWSMIAIWNTFRLIEFCLLNRVVLGQYIALH